MSTDSAASPALPVPGTVNFRDLGGYPTPGGRTRNGVIFRSDGLAHLGAEGRQAIQNLGVRTVIDLRDEQEHELMPDDIEGLGIHRIEHPVFEGSLRQQSGHESSLGGMYESILHEHGGVIASVLHEVTAPSATPVVVHCTAGKDRTGVVAAIILLTAGVRLSTVLDDYEATAANLAGPWVDRMTELMATHGIALSPQMLTIMSASPREELEGALATVLDAPGGLEAYLDGLGFGAEAREQLRRRMVEPAGE